MDGRLAEPEYLKLPIQLTEQVRRGAEEADSFKQECSELYRKVEKLRGLLLQVRRLSRTSMFYESPTKRIMDEAKRTLEKTLTLVKKCKKSGILKRVITITSATDFRKVNIALDSTVEDLNWLLAVSNGGGDTVGLPPIVATDPNLALVWQQIAKVQAGSPEDKADGAGVLASLASSSERNGKIIIEEGGLVPLIKLLAEGPPAGQEAAARALKELVCDQQRAQEAVKSGAIPAFVHVLADAPVKVLTQAAYALAAIVSCDKEAQGAFGAAGVIRHLVALVNDTMEEAARKKVSNMHTLVTTRMAQNKAKQWPEEDAATTLEPKPGSGKARVNVSTIGDSRKSNSRSSDSLSYLDNGGGSGKAYYGSSIREHNRREREHEDPDVLLKMRGAVVQALWKLASGNVKNCKLITDTRALLCFAKLIEKEEGEVQENAVMAVAEIAAVAEVDPELRRAAFKYSSQSVKAVVDQLLKVIKSGKPELQIPSLKAIGCLSRIFPAKETHIVKPLTEQLGSPDNAVALEAAAALIKFTHPDNYLNVEHSKSILEANGASSLVQLASMASEVEPQQDAVILLCNLAENICNRLAKNVGNHDAMQDPGTLQALEALQEAGALKALEAVASRLPQVTGIREALPKAIDQLELFQAGIGGSQEDDFGAFRY